MARKDLLKNLMGDATAPPPDSPEAPAPRQPRYTKGAIGAVSQSIAQLKSRAMVDIPADQIEMGGLQDRLGEDAAEHERLKASLQEYGQQVPVLLRHIEGTEDRFQIVYGRRRVAALRDLGLPVKAIVRDLSDHDLVVAQGQENSARRDLTFIEKANFARQMRDEGFERKVICDALHIDKTVISRMLSVADTVPLVLIEAIGPAPAAGRDRWRKLADGLGPSGKSPARVAALLSGENSDARFEEALQLITRKPAKSPAPVAQELRGSAGRIGQAKKSGRKTTLTFDATEAQGFEDWLIENISELHRNWRDQSGE
ncbi:plasmid partitioning protein RepB [Salipiger sp. P9]|uniref:plasmid partitioning protein RepB n=1 Tax=Salipiger pentaromativorans TaxID=2943193 RepID=UPI0021570305|nr:plasmid partitioning protein RepB [Salipiger pentaromativorans]MCR8550566.1 plasmid partitioning protein RepB [Salipiger pentaromativorans]